MGSLFIDVALSQAAHCADPQNPRNVHAFADRSGLAFVVDALLQTAVDVPDAEDLPRRLEVAAGALAGDLRLGDALAALKDLAGGFEVFLKLVARVKFESRPELLSGSERHVGFYKTPLGGLLMGVPASRPGMAHEEVPENDKARIVRFDPKTKDIASRVFDATRLIRNEVHEARPFDAFSLLGKARTVLAAYLFAADQNLPLLTRSLYPHRRYLTGVVESDTKSTPFVIPLAFTVKGGRSGQPTPFGERGTEVDQEQVQRVFCGSGPVGVLLSGEPGAGKTTVLKALVADVARRKLGAPLSSVPLPIYVEANRFTNFDDFLSLASVELRRDRECIGDLARSGALLLVIDGLNEVAPSQQTAALACVRNFIAGFQSAKVVVSTRFPRTLESLDLVPLELRPLTDAQQRQFVEASMGDVCRAASFLEELAAVPRLRELCRVPLLLHMLLDIAGESFRVPENRGRLLHEFMSRYLERERLRFGSIDPLAIQFILAHLAFAMRSEGAVSMPAAKVEVLVNSWLGENKSPVAVLDALRAIREARILREGADSQVVFFHELIQEYFAALELRFRYESDPTVLRGLERDPWWKEVLVLFSGLSDRKECVVAEIATESVALSAHCAVDESIPNERLEALVVDRAGALLRERPDRQGEALEALGTVWNEQARRTVGAELTKGTAIAGFLTSFTAHPRQAAAQLLATVPSGATLAAAVRVLKSRDDGVPSQTASAELGSAILQVAEALIARAGVDVTFATLGRLARHASMDESELPRALAVAWSALHRNEAEFVFELLRSFGILACDQLLIERLATVSTRKWKVEIVRAVNLLSPLSRELAETLVGRLVARGAFGLASELAQAAGDIDWARAIAIAGAEDLLGQKGPLENALSFVAATVGRAGTADVLRLLVHQGSVPEWRLGSVLGVVDDADFTLRATEDYLSAVLSRKENSEEAAALLLAPWAPAMSGEGVVQACRWLRDTGVVSSAVKVAIRHDCGSEGERLVREAIESARGGTISIAEPPWRSVVFGPLWSRFEPAERASLVRALLDSGLSAAGVDDLALDARASVCQSIENNFDGFIPRLSPEAAERLGLGNRCRDGAMRRCWELLTDQSVSHALELSAIWGVSLDFAEAERRSGVAAARVRGLAEELVSGWVDRGEYERASLALTLWGLRETGSIAAFVGLRDGRANAELVWRAAETGEASRDDIAAWLVAVVERGDIDTALRIVRPRIRQLLAEPVAACVEILLQREQYGFAGQLIVAYGLVKDFSSALQDLVPRLIETGKPGIATQLAKALGPQYRADYVRIVIAAVARALSEGRVGSASSLVSATGIEFVRRELTETILSAARDPVTGSASELAEAIVADVVLARVVGKDALADALSRGAVWLHATVESISHNRGFAFVKHQCLPSVVFLHSSLDSAAFTRLVLGASVRIRVGKDSNGRLRATAIGCAEPVATQAAVLDSPLALKAWTVAQKGQVHGGLLVRDGEQWCAVLDGLSNERVVVRSFSVEPLPGDAGRRADFYVLRSSKRDGVVLRLDHLR